MQAEIISNPKNTQIKDLVRLHEGKHRRRQQQYLIEGRRELERALEAGIEPLAFYFCPEFCHEVPAPVQEKVEHLRIPCFQLTEEAFRKVSLRENPDGILATAATHWRSLDEITLSKAPFILVMERIEKPGNLGTLLRTADAAGVELVILCEPLIDTTHPQVIRNSQGGVFAMQVTVSDNATCMEWLLRNGVQLVATTPGAARSFWDCDYKQPTAMFLGSEAYGLSDFWLKSPHITPVGIPMAGLGDSLNVAAAAAVSLYEVVRQRF